MSRIVAWFSCGAASAVAAKRVVEKYGDDAVVVYCDTMSTEHPDNRRFFDDVQRWIGRPIEVIRSSRFVSIDDVFERRRYMSGVKGAICTTELKKKPREAWQRPGDVHVFGYTAEERGRADDFEENNTSLRVEWILIDEWITKERCHEIIRSAGIAEPAMYVLDYDHNNCLGCVKSSSPDYWNAIRRDFPDVFARRARQSRILGVRLVRLHGVRIFLDELPEDATGAEDGPIECGPVCQTSMPWD